MRKILLLAIFAFALTAFAGEILFTVGPDDTGFLAASVYSIDADSDPGATVYNLNPQPGIFDGLTFTDRAGTGHMDPAGYQDSRVVHGARGRVRRSFRPRVLDFRDRLTGRLVPLP